LTGCDRQRVGHQAEELALNYLQSQRLQLVCRNWTCRHGELDLVMLDGDTVVFVEVRYRRHSAWGGALESIDRRKRQKLVRTAQLFLQQETRWSGNPCRFDVVTLQASSPAAIPNWIRNAFDG